MAKVRIEVVNALAELERLSWSWESSGPDEIKVKCPAHEDDTPSCQFNVKKNVWVCHATQCRAKGDIATFIAYALKSERKIVIEELSDRYPLQTGKTLNPDLVEKFRAHLKEAGPLLASLKNRGITDEMMRVARLGFWKGRITIPVFGPSGELLDVRRYLPDAPPRTRKMLSTPGYGAVRLYQVDQIKKFDRIWVCGGEMKALVVAQLLNSFGIGAVSPIPGEGKWDVKWNSQFKGKTVFICMDIDEAGDAATKLVAKHLRPASARAFVIKLPLDPEVHPKGDINDYVGTLNAGADELIKLMETAEEFVPPKSDKIDLGPAKSVSLMAAIRAENVQKLLKFEGKVFGYFETPYFVPAKVAINCDKNQNNCALCPIYGSEDDPVLKINPHSEAFLSIVDAPSKSKRTALMDAFGLPPCRSVKFIEVTRSSVWDVRLSPNFTLDQTGPGSNMKLPAFIVGDRIETNVPYSMEGVTYPHPKTQSAIIVVGESEQAEDSLESFSPTNEELDALSIFEPEKWTEESIGDRLEALYHDLAYNVTGVYGRQDMHLIMDLAWHSALHVPFEGRTIHGWLNALVLGDSGQGKSEVAMKLLGHYRLGDRVVCKNASIAGLVGGLQQIGNRWFVSWGVIPQQDGRLVLAEELKGLPTTDIGKMTDMRSSGIAELPKIERGQANARTRILATSNVRAERRTMASYAHGVNAVVELMGAAEDVRRWDIVCAVTKDQVPPSVINMRRADRAASEHWALSDLCRRMILFSWTRKPKQIVFDEAAEDAVQAAAIGFSKIYSDMIPLLDRGTTREKITRLSVALAARTGSREGENLVIRLCHVDYIRNFLDRIYTASSLGYRTYSEAQKESKVIVDADSVITAIKTSKFPLDSAKCLLRSETIGLDDISAFFSVDRDIANELLSLFLRKQCLTRAKKTYHKTEAFITLLRALLEDGLVEENESEF